MAGRAFDFKEFAIESFYSLKGLVEQFVEDFRSRDRYFKYKAGIVAAWFLISGTTFGIACGGGPRDNSLHANTDVTKVLDDTSLLLLNDSTSTWHEVHLTLNGKYTAYTPEIGPGGKFVLKVQQFVGPEGEIPAKDLAPRTLRVACTEGNDTLDLAKPHADN